RGTAYDVDLPRGLQGEFAQQVQAVADAEGGEIVAAEIYALFLKNYLGVAAPLELVSYTHEADESGDRLVARLRSAHEEVTVDGFGNGAIAALVHALEQHIGMDVHVRDFHQHAMSAGEDASAAAYVEATVGDDIVWGVAIHPSAVTAALRAVVNAVNRAAI